MEHTPRQEDAIDLDRLRDLLSRVQRGDIGVTDAMDRLRDLPYEDLGFAKLDHHRTLRTGFPEVVMGLGKSPDQVAEIVERLAARSDCVLVTRVGEDALSRVRERVPDAAYHGEARCIVVDRRDAWEPVPGVVVATAGTADVPVAEEAALTAELLGSGVERVYDVGVAGLHRLLDKLGTLQEARVIVVVAGMEGALPSLVSGLVGAPIIAVPTSVGYGASFDGLAALLAMLNGCAPGVSVVNIDNGFGGGYLAGMINRLGPPRASTAPPTVS